MTVTVEDDANKDIASISKKIDHGNGYYSSTILISFYWCIIFTVYDADQFNVSSISTIVSGGS